MNIQNIFYGGGGGGKGRAIPFISIPPYRRVCKKTVSLDFLFDFESSPSDSPIEEEINRTVGPTGFEEILIFEPSNWHIMEEQVSMRGIMDFG